VSPALSDLPLRKVVRALESVGFPNTPGKPIKVGCNPLPIAVTPDGSTVYVACRLSSRVIPIQVATNKALAPIKVGRHPDSIVFTPDGKTAYVANSGSDTVTPIRVATNTALKPIKTGRSPNAIVITP
jgi:YVTN family beta-propeller protein